jgi:DNA-binding response OmpR family regulator
LIASSDSNSAPTITSQTLQPRELVLRVKKYCNGGRWWNRTYFGSATCSSNAPRRLVSWRGKAVELTATEFKLLTFWPAADGRCNRAKTIAAGRLGIQQSRGHPHGGHPHAPPPRKLGQTAKYLDTVRGVGTVL